MKITNKMNERERWKRETRGLEKLEMLLGSYQPLIAFPSLSIAVCRISLPQEMGMKRIKLYYIL